MKKTFLLSALGGIALYFGLFALRALLDAVSEKAARRRSAAHELDKVAPLEEMLGDAGELSPLEADEGMCGTSGPLPATGTLHPFPA